MASEAMALLLGCVGVSGTVFTVVNRCTETIWPGVLTGNQGASLSDGDFSLTTGQSSSINPPTGWSGRFWGCTCCNFDASGAGSCATGDCGRGLKCNDAGGASPATLAEFTLNGDDNKDFYDVSLVDGYNVPLKITLVGGSGDCQTAGCVADLWNPAALKVSGSNGQVIAYKSACEAFSPAPRPIIPLPYVHDHPLIRINQLLCYQPFHLHPGRLYHDLLSMSCH